MKQATNLPRESLSRSSGFLNSGISLLAVLAAQMLISPSLSACHHLVFLDRLLCIISIIKNIISITLTNKFFSEATSPILYLDFLIGCSSIIGLTTSLVSSSATSLLTNFFNTGFLILVFGLSSSITGLTTSHGCQK